MDPYKDMLLVRRKKQEICDLRRAAQITNTSMDKIAIEIMKNGKFENELWVVGVAELILESE